MEELRLRDKIAESDGSDPFEPFRDVLTFKNRAVDWFHRGDNASKRLIVETVGSNLFLKDKILNIEAKKPFAALTKTPTIPLHLGVVDDVRTLSSALRQEMTKLASEICQTLDDDEGRLVLNNIRVLRERFEPEVLAKEKGQKCRLAKAA